MNMLFRLAFLILVPAVIACGGAEVYCGSADRLAYVSGETKCDVCYDANGAVDCDELFGLTNADTGSPVDTDADTGSDPIVDTVDVDGDGVAAEDDCDDLNAAVTTGYTWYGDADSDGYGDVAWPMVACTQPTRFVANAADCNDLDATVNPAATEICDEVDNDCDGAVDDNPSDGQFWYEDLDDDGYGVAAPTDESSIVWACSAPSGYVDSATDCNDDSVLYHPSASEADCADPNDYNCDGFTGAVDADRDGYFACEECNDGNAAVNPAADELCDRVDNDCDGRTDTTDAVDATPWYADADGDEFGDELGDPYYACTSPEGRVADATDCDDRDPVINPDGAEVCDAEADDEDCDGLVEDADPSVTGQTLWYADNDHDGFGNAYDLPLETCETLPAPHVANDDDCDDLDRSVYPGAAEYVGNNVDDDCDGVAE